MNKLLICLSMSVALLCITGCSGFYYGYSLEEWNSLTAYEQEKAREEYKDVRYAHQQNIFGNPPEEATDAFIERAIKTKAY
jgi:hypothetical protein